MYHPDNNSPLRSVFIGALLSTLASGMATFLVEEVKGYVARKRKAQEGSDENRAANLCKNCRKTIN